MSNTKLLSFAVVAGLMAAATATGNTGVRHDSAAITYDEVQALNARAGDYTFALTTAAKGSGAWLTDVDVTIRAMPQGDVVLEHRTQGPLLMVDLKPGRYEVTAVCGDVCADGRAGAAQAQKRMITVPRTGRVQSVIHFNADD